MTEKEQAKLDAQVRSGDPLSKIAFGHHLKVACDKAVTRITKASGLDLEGSTYPWRRIWRAIHGTEGAQLAQHLAELKARHPDSTILGRIEDLEAALRAPLIDFAAMARGMGQKPDTLSKALHQGRTTLPFPVLDLGGRNRRFRPLEVQLWSVEEIMLDLPKLPTWAIPVRPELKAKCAAPTSPEHLDQNAAEDAKKAIFGACGGDSRTSPA